MVQVLQHEPFYNCGTWSDAAAGVYIGWVLRKGGIRCRGMPFRNEDGNRTFLLGRGISGTWNDGASAATRACDSQMTAVISGASV